MAGIKDILGYSWVLPPPYGAGLLSLSIQLPLFSLNGSDLPVSGGLT